MPTITLIKKKESKKSMVNCKTCNKYIGTDKRRRYCDTHREFRGGRWRQKGKFIQYFKDKKRGYNQRQTRKTGSGFSEHLITNKRTGEADFIRERINVRKEKRRIGI